MDFSPLPLKSRRALFWWAWLAGALIAATAIIQFFWMDTTVGNYDEGLVLFGADRVLRGDIPYRDFWTLYGPGSFYVLAGLFRVFGEQVLVERGFDIVSKTTIIVLSFLIVRSFGNRATAFVAAALNLGLLLYLRSYGAPLFPSVAAALAMITLLHHAWIRAAPPSAFWAGVAAGTTTLFRHDLGAYAFLAALFFFYQQRRRFDNVARPDAMKRLTMSFVIGLTVSIVPIFLWLAWTVPSADLYRDLIRIPIFVYPHVRELPFPSLIEAFATASRAHAVSPLGDLVVYLPIVVIGAGLGGEALRRLRRTRVIAQSPDAVLFQLLLLLGAMFFVKGLVRVSPFQMGPALIVSVLVLMASLARAQNTKWHMGLTAVAGLACLALLAKPLITFSERRTSGVSSERWLANAPALCPSPALARLRCMRLDENREAIASFLLAHGSAGKRVYMGLGRHDKIFVADLALYFAAEVVAPTRWHDLHPGVQTTRAVQTQMIDELMRGPPAFVVLDSSWDGMNEPNDSAHSSGIRLLDQYLEARFTPVFVSGPLSVLVPRVSGAIR